MALDPALVFQLTNGLALLAWLALIVSPPSAPWTRRVWWLSGRAIPVLLSATYLLMMVTQWRGEGGFGSIEEVRALFDVPWSAGGRLDSLSGFRPLCRHMDCLAQRADLDWRHNLRWSPCCC